MAWSLSALLLVLLISFLHPPSSVVEAAPAKFITFDNPRPPPGVEIFVPPDIRLSLEIPGNPAVI